MPERTIVFTKNENDEYFRKSTEFASADVVLKDEKSTGSIERLSATILKGVQDQMFGIARQKKIEVGSQKLTKQYIEEYHESFMENSIKDIRKKDKSISVEQAKEESEKLYIIKKKNIDRLAEKEAWRETIKKEVADDELIFKFDAKSIFDYAKVHGGGHKDRLYNDVKKIQQRFNNWTEKKFDIKSGKIVDKEVTGVLFPYSQYTHGENSTIEIKLEKEMLQMVLFLNKAFLKYHLDSYIKVGTPNATRLYEVLIDYIAGNLFSSGRDLSFDYLQKKFNTNYKIFRLFLQRLMTPSLEKINSELGTSITWEADKKKGKAIQTIKFIISTHDKRILQGIRDDDVEEHIRYSLEYYCTLLSLAGQRTQGGLKPMYEKIRGAINEGKFDFFGKTKDEITKEHMQNLEDAEELESLIARDNNLAELYYYDAKYLNAMEIEEDSSFIATSATETLEYIKSSYLIPKGILSPALPFFESFEEERALISSLMPLKFKITEKRIIIIDENNFDSMKATIEPYLNSCDRFDFNSGDQQKRFCEIFKIEYFDTCSAALEAEVVEDNNCVAKGEFQGLHELLQINGMAKTKAELKKWDTVVEELGNIHGSEEVTMTITFLLSGVKDAEFWLKQIPTPAKFKKHFISVLHISKVDKASIMQKIKNDPQIKTRIMVMERAGQSQDEIEAEVAQMVQKGLESGTYGTSIKEAPWVIKNREKRAEGEMMAEAMKEAGFSSIFDWMKSLSD